MSAWSPHRDVVVLGLLVALAGAACGGGAERPPADRAAADTAAPRDTAASVDPADDPPEPADAAPIAGDDPVPADDSADWTAGATRAERAVRGVATLRDVRTARHDGFDRIVLDFGSDAVPGWAIEYVDRPVIQCGSGDPIAVAGDGWLRIHTQPARAHDDEGRATVGERRRAPALPVLAELVLTCDFEAHLEWVAGVASPNRYRVLELAAPNRLVVDIRHAPR